MAVSIWLLPIPLDLLVSTSFSATKGHPVVVYFFVRFGYDTVLSFDLLTPHTVLTYYGWHIGSEKLL